MNDIECRVGNLQFKRLLLLYNQFNASERYVFARGLDVPSRIQPVDAQVRDREDRDAHE